MKIDGGSKTEAMYSHPFSLNEFEYGVFDDANGKLILSNNLEKHFQRGDTAKGKQVSALRREYWLNETGNLCYKLYMGIDGKEPELHLEAELTRSE